VSRLKTALLALALPALAAADEPPTCDTSGELLSGPALLRALSLDLRGVVPSEEEYGLLDEAGEVPEAVIDAWLASPGFVDRAVRRHDALLWPNVGDIRLMSNHQRLSYDYDEGVYYRYLVAPNYRGGPIPCGDFPARWDEHGELITQLSPEGWLQEGWVEVEPYWNPGHTVHVCAFEAQTQEVSPWGTACDTYDSRYDPNCGCGPNLRWCDTFSLGHVQEDGYVAPVHRSLANDVRRRVARVVEDDLSYLELFTSRVAYVNGPLAHFYRYQTRLPAHVRFNELPIDPALLPDLAFTDEDTWVEVELGEEQSGILTSPMYLMKFQTRRARTNRFYNAFLCQPFQPPDSGIPNVSSTSQTLNLRERPGCNYCHAILEPAGSHWARWGEYGVGYLDPAHFPVHDDACERCADDGTSCPESCATYYVVDPLSSEEDPFVGSLKAFEFLEDRHVPNTEQGPKKLAYDGVVDGRLPRCVAQRTAEWLLGRSPYPWEADWVDELASGFVDSDFRWRRLVKAIVTSDSYRRAR
jgi:hypothetical protein